MAIPNAEYWARRMEITNNALLDRGFDYVQNLDDQWGRAIAGIEKDIAAWYQRFADNNAISYTEARKWLTAGELKEFRWTVEEYIKRAEESALDGRWIKELENASARVHISRLDALKVQLQQQAELLHGGQLDGLDAHLRRTYLDRYYTTAYEIQKGIGTGWTVHDLSTSVVDRVLARPWTLDRQTFSDRIWANKQALVNKVNTHLTQMIIRGEAPQKTIATLAHDMNVSKAQAGRLVMTESAYFSAAAQKDCFNNLGVEEYVIIATLDSNTSEICREMDGKVFKMSEYEEGLTAPPFHPWCRTVTAPYFADMQELGSRARRDPDTGSTVVDVPRNMTYKQWHEKFVKPAPTTSQSVPKSDIIKGTAHTMAEAARQSQQYASAATYRGVKNLDAVNDLNGTLEHLSRTYKGRPLAEIKTSSAQDAWASANFKGLYPRAHFLNDPAGTVASSTVNWAADNARLTQQWTAGLKQLQDTIAATTDKSVLRTLRTEERRCLDILARLTERSKYTRHNVVYAGYEVRSVVTHEYGHILADQLFGQINSTHANPAFANNVNNALYQRVQQVRQVFSKAVADGDVLNISMYAAKNEREFLAEAFTMYDMGMETLPDYIAQMIKEVFDL